MEKRSFDKWNSVVSEVKPKSSGVLLRCNFPGRLITFGSVTGLRYESPSNGSVITVNEKDVADLLTKTFGAHSCCGGVGKPLPKFSLVTQEV